MGNALAMPVKEWPKPDYKALRSALKRQGITTCDLHVAETISDDSGTLPRVWFMYVDRPPELGPRPDIHGAFNPEPANCNARNSDGRFGIDAYPSLRALKRGIAEKKSSSEGYVVVWRWGRQ
jgi:hypothetical protein